MRLNKISETITFQTKSNLTDIRNIIFPNLTLQFNGIGLIGTIKGDSIEFEKPTQKPDDFGRIWKLRNLFSIIRFAQANLIVTHDQRKAIQISIDLTYLFIISFGFGICFCLGFAFFISDIGLFVYLSTAFSIMTLFLTVGCIYIWTELAEIIMQVKKLKL